jgi:putative membrane protein
MKKNIASLLAAALVSGLLLTSCNNDHKPENSEKVAEKKNDEKFENKAAEKDAQFLVDATTISLEEVALGEIAKTNGTLSEVKELGSTMVADHQKAIEEVKALAAKKGVSIPERLPDNVQEDIGKYSKKTGKDFDKDYCDKMVDGHKNAIDKFEKEAKDGQDAEIKAWAEQTLPTLRKHLDHATACQEKCKNKK